MSIRDCIGEIESSRHTRVLVFASSQLEIDMLPPLYEALSQIGRCQKLDVVFYSRGGIINAARRIALLLREFAERVCFLVPHYCESAGTVAALSADEIIAGPLAIFSPIDPLLMASRTGNQNGPLAMSVQDLRLFSDMTVEWFGLEQQESKDRSLAVLCDHIFPSTLTSFYRSTLEVQEVCAELLALHLNDDHAALRKQIAEKLIFGFHSHTFALTRGDLQALGLPVKIDPKVEGMMWPIARELRATVGPGARDSLNDEWLDTLIATRQGAQVRRRADDFPGRWQDWELS